MRRVFLFLAILSTLSFATAPAKHPPAVAEKKPLDLAELSAKDTASFETYSHRIALVQDSITATQKEIENTKKKIAKQTPLKPKGEYEKKTEFDARKAKWEKEIDEKTLQDSKHLADRLSELEIAKKHIEENQKSLYCTLDITTHPGAASIYFNKEEIGASPAEYHLALPGYAVIRIQKENFYPWDTTLTLNPAQKLKLDILLQEKTIFSEEGEIYFLRTLARDTTVAGYRARIERVKARIAQIDEEIKVIFEKFPETYPALEPQRPDENLHEFERRKNSWQNEGERQIRALKDKYNSYRAKLTRSIETIGENIIATESKLIAEQRPNARITLGNYDADKESFEIEVQDTANALSPFHFVGKVGIPRDTAKVMNKSTEGFFAGVSYLNYPFVYGDSSFNLAMKEIAVYRKNVHLKAAGAFKNIGRFEAMEGYNQWRPHADSLLNSALRVQGFDVNYALKGERAKIAAEDAAATSEENNARSGGLGWRGWTRILTFTAAAGLGAVAVVTHLDAEKNKKDFNNAKNEEPTTTKNLEADYTTWYNGLEDKKKDVEKKEKNRTYFSVGAGAFAVAGILTFVF